MRWLNADEIELIVIKHANEMTDWWLAVTNKGKPYFTKLWPINAMAASCDILMGFVQFISTVAQHTK